MLSDTQTRAIQAFKSRPRLLRLGCGVQHYDWGDPQAIPTMLGRPNPRGRPFAELWAGAHPDLPSQAMIEGTSVPLDLLIQEAAVEILGAEVVERFGPELPFLLKIIAAAKPLSIQAHPDREQAEQGFARENLKGLSLHAPARNYRDPHHKPELLVALSEIYALCGFRPLNEIRQTLRSAPELSSLVPRDLCDEKALSGLYENIMGLSQAMIDARLAPFIARLEREESQRALSKREHAYWVLRAHRAFSSPSHIDRGLFSILLLNLLRLEPGQGIFLPAGELHAYLRGIGVEIMANSNNVLRGGLTKKHVDTRELIRVLHFRGRRTPVLDPRKNLREPWLQDYKTPAQEFALSRLQLSPRQRQELPPQGMLIGLVTQGPISLLSRGEAPLRVEPAVAFLVPAGLGCEVRAETGAQVWLARVPDGNG